MKGNYAVNYSEYLAATIDINTIVKANDGKILRVFNQFDVDATGEITRDNLKMAFTKFGKQLSDEEIDTYMELHDTNKDGSIGLEEFKRMLLMQDDDI